VQLAQREAAAMKSGVAHLKDMASLAYPVGSSLIVWGVALALIALVYFIPYVRKRLELSRLAREEARRRYQLQSRGAKIARRRGAARR
jgi:type VI protein secretion system component VasF